jgi:hypothetical protein
MNLFGGSTLNRRVLLLFSIAAAFISLTGFSPVNKPVPFADAYHDGYQLVLWKHHDDATLKKIIARVQETGATHLTVPYFGCQSSITSADVGSCHVRDRETEQSVRAAQIAAMMGMDVSFLPIIVTPKWDWRALFDPIDVDGWFVSYKAWLKNMVQIANQVHAKEFIVGTEFTKLYRYEDRWSQLLKEFHELFAGPLIVTVNWDSIDHKFWKDADAIGISEYESLSSTENPSQAELDRGMQKVKSKLLRIANKWHRPLHLTEIGFPSTHAAALHPWLAESADGVDPQLQARCFEAFRNTWKNEPLLVRASIWATSDPGASDASWSFETIGKPAESSIRDLFSERAQLGN